MLLIFDLDMTLVDVSSVDFEMILRHALEISGVDMPMQEEIKELWHSGSDHPLVLERWGVKNILSFWNYFDEKDEEMRKKLMDAGTITLFPDVAPALERLEQIEEIVLAIHTNTPKPLAKIELDRFDLTKHFDFILALNDGDYNQLKAKPESWGINHIIKKMQKRNLLSRKHSYREVAFIGDSEIDMIAASRAGIPGIQILRGGVNPSVHATRVITSLNDLDYTLLQSIFHVKKHIRDHADC